MDYFMKKSGKQVTESSEVSISAEEEDTAPATKKQQPYKSKDGGKP